MTTFSQQLHRRFGMTSLTRPPRQAGDRHIHATHIVVSRRRFARAIGTQDHNVRLAIWLAGWHIEIYDEPGQHSLV